MRMRVCAAEPVATSSQRAEPGSSVRCPLAIRIMPQVRAEVIGGGA
jgi:hypothetical protein